jgi:hypothetical protein
MRYLMLVLFAGVVGAAPVPEPPEPPAGPAPTFLTITGATIDKDTLHLQSREYVGITTVTYVKEMEGNLPVFRPVMVTEFGPVAKYSAYPLSEITLTTAEGKPLTPEAALILLNGTSVVLLSAGPLDPAYRKVLARDAVVLVKKK